LPKKSGTALRPMSLVPKQAFVKEAYSNLGKS